MFITLLAVTFTIALAVSLGVTRLFRGPISSILSRLVEPAMASAWHRYMEFAVIVVGVSGGVRIWELEKYITPREADTAALVLNMERWVLEVYRTLIGTLQNAAWLLLIFFGVALVAFVVVRGMELLRAQRSASV
ncbi:MAG: hypothetical protein GKS06_12185 [Acidobacteria bacterium]|nr:hypothetical protein [Acidobacteriota bacterium]